MNQAWLITGAGRGLGRHLTEQILEHGGRVAATIRTEGQLDELKARYGERLWIAPLDLTDADQIFSTVNRAFTTLERIDVVVSNAGYSLVGSAEEVTTEAIRHIIDTNLTGSIQLARAVLPHLRRQGGGRILQVSSSAGQTAIPGVSLYVATKWGIEGFFEALIQEVAPFGIEATLVEPGGIRTDFASRSVMADEMAAYRDTPVKMVRDLVVSGFHDAPGNPAKMAAAMIESVSQHPAPKRLVLGSDAFQGIDGALRGRLTELHSQQNIAFSTDYQANDQIVGS